MTISIRCLLQEAEEILQNMALEELAEDVAETENGKILVLGGWWVEIPSLEITLRAGISCYQETEPPGYFPEAPIRVIAETGKEESKTEIWVFEGEAAFSEVLFVYIQGEMEPEEIERLPCFLCVPEEGAYHHRKDLMNEET